MANASEIVFVVPGDALPVATRSSTHGQVREGVRLAASHGGKSVTLKARPGEDVVRLTIANGPTLVLHPESASALLGGGDGPVVVHAQHGWSGIEAAALRDGPGGWLGRVTLSSVEVLSDVAPELGADLAEEEAARLLARKIDAQVDPGVYALDAARFDQSLKAGGCRPLAQVPAAAGGGPLLVLVHGTFVESQSTFGKLWAGHPEKVRSLFDAYQGRVYAFEHRTVGESPLRNALALVAALPEGARLHLLTHSRGGLVAEVLARACGSAEVASAGLSADDAADFEQLARNARARKLQVERMVRVACPAHGTLLASRRLDAYLSVLTWVLGLAGQVVPAAVMDFLHGVAKKRADPAVLPGLAAMMPESPFIQWLAAQREPVPGDLRVVAGDVQGDSIASWVKTLVADAFYWTDNDFVVHTRAMYGGVRRADGGARFLLDRGGKVSHFNYFVNESTVAAILDALLQDAPGGFEPIGPKSWSGEDASGTRAIPASGAPDCRPIVTVVPGFLGSALAREGRRVWPADDPAEALAQLAWPDGASPATPQALDADLYEPLVRSLAQTHDVLAFAYDWRAPLEQEAARLADVLLRTLDARGPNAQPVRLLTHSTGALLVRTMALVRPDAWRRLMQQDGARVVMLAPANHGTWAPLQMLTGDSAVGQDPAARAALAGFPGLLQGQAGLDDAGLAQAATWQGLRDADVQGLAQASAWHDTATQEAVYGWPVPAQALLDGAAALRKKLDAQTLAAPTGKLAIVVGQAPFTPARCVLEDGRLSFEDAAEGGDGCVTLSSAQLPGVPAWTVPVAHGKLPQASDAFAAYAELLSQGSTARLQRVTAAETRGTPAPLARTRPSRSGRDPHPPQPSSALGTPDVGTQRRSTAQALSVRVINGDVQFIAEPLLLGHYRSLTLTGSERVVDRLVAGAMRHALAAGLYPAEPGTHQVFANERPHPANPLEMARPRAAIVVGLGEEGKLTATQLSFSVRQAVLAYAQRLSEQAGGTQSTLELCATLVGSGGPRMSAGTSAQSVAQGVMEANEKLGDTGWPRVARLTLVELFLERAADAWHALRQQETSWANRIRLEGFVEQRPGGMRRSVDSSYRGASYDFISALSTRDVKGDVCIAYELDTRRARTEVRAVHAQTALVRELVATASNSASDDPLIGRTLFNLLVPPEIEPYLAEGGEMVIEVDAGTAVIPWELLKSNPDGASSDARPWSVRSRVLRKLRTDRFRERVRDATAQDAVLVIGEPLVPPEYPPLDGALAEAQAVVTQVGAQLAAGQVTALLDHPDARTVINGLFARSYRIVHVAGHGAPGPEGGVVLSGQSFLGAKEIAAMRTVPELVFLNCCHLARRDVQDLGRGQDRARFAANVADELIAIGVRCVIAAGWAVEDGPAEEFATRFYASLLQGARFIDAVGAAREAAWRANPQGNTWAAYQCYGDPSWRWNAAADDRAPAAAGTDDVAEIASSVGLVLALDNLVTEARFGAREPRAALDRIRLLEGKYGAQWGAQGDVAEAFGLAYAELEAFTSAMEWLQRAMTAGDGGATLGAAEQLASVRTRVGEQAQDAAAIRTGIAELEHLLALGATSERLMLLGAATRRLALLAWKQQQAQDAVRAARQSAAWFEQAHHKAQAADAANAFEPARAAIESRLVASMMEGRRPKAEAAQLAILEHMTQSAAAVRPEFGTVAGLASTQMLQGLVQGKLQSSVGGIVAELRELHGRVPAPRLWDSVHNDARLILTLYRDLPKAAQGEAQAVDALLGVLAGFAQAPA